MSIEKYCISGSRGGTNLRLMPERIFSDVKVTKIIIVLTKFRDLGGFLFLNPFLALTRVHIYFVTGFEKFRSCFFILAKACNLY